MACETDLRILLKAMDEGILACPAVAEVGRTWLASGQPSLMEHLVERGLLTQQQVQQFETALNLGPDRSFSSDSSPPKEMARVVAAHQATAESEGSTHSGASSASSSASSAVGVEKRASSAGSSFPGPERYFQFRSYREGEPGQTWLAWDNALGREVVVKSLRPDLAKKPAMLARFIREARITGQLEHPNIIPVYDLIEAGSNGENWAYSMRHMGGSTLTEAIDQYHERLAKGDAGHFDLVSLLDRFVLVCKAVAFAHSRQVIHRDLKGQNVVVGDFGEVTVVGWGFGKKLADVGPEAHAEGEPQESREAETLQELEGEPLTADGTINGTPGYMSPEVASGEPATKASDIYSLGAILYRILAGRSPYRGTTPVETLEMVKKGPPSLPRSLNTSISPVLEAITLKAMARTPKDRYAAAENLADDVRRWLADEPVSVYRDSLAVRMFRWALKHRTATVAATAFLLIASAALSIGSARFWQEQRGKVKQNVGAEISEMIADELSESGFDQMEISEVFFLANGDFSDMS